MINIILLGCIVIITTTQISTIAFQMSPVTSSPRPSMIFADAAFTAEDRTNWQLLPRDDASKLSEIWNHKVEWDADSRDYYTTLYDTLRATNDTFLKPRINEALDCLEDSVRLYGSDSILSSFNGGKDAVVILQLVCSVLAKHGIVERPRAIYFDAKDEFPALRQFTHDTVESTDIEMLAFPQGVGFVEGLSALIDAHQPRPLAFVLGTRDGDPNASGQGHFAPSSSYMPPFMRVNPIIHWNYGHVWHFLRLFDIPYCKLYDQGYTSLGSVKNTMRCPALLIEDEKYLPAYMLRDWDQERAGRFNPSEKKAQVHDATSVQTVSRTATETEYEDKDSVLSDTLDAQKNNMQTTVAILVVGDEILKGFTPDTNTLVAAQALRKHNVILKQVVVVSDTVHEIAEEIRRLQQIVDVVITSGGVGPTNDDVTISGVAAALEMTMGHHEEMAELIRKKMNVTEWTDSLNKMAILPQQAKLKYLSGPDAWPVLQCQNVFVLPGIPEFFAPKVESVAEYLSYHTKGLTYKVVLRVEETAIVEVLNEVVTSHPSVSIGSYPFVSQPEFKTIITVEGRPDDDAAVHLALGDLIEKVPSGSVLRVDNNMTVFGG